MKLGVYSLRKILFQGEAELLNCKTELGEITILDNHRPLVAALKQGLMKIVDRSKKDYYIPIEAGFVEVQFNNECRAIVEEKT